VEEISVTVQPLAVGTLHAPSRSAWAIRRSTSDGLLATAAQALDRLGEHVVLFRYREWVFVNFGLFAALGAWLTMGLMGAILIGQGVAPGQFLGMAVLGCAAVVAGSWLAAQLFDLRVLLADRRGAVRRPVFVSWGGVLALALVFAGFAGLSGHGVLMMLDAGVRSIFLGHAVGRLGCLSYGCCFGRPTRSRLAITYSTPHAKAVRVGGLGGVPLHPAALYEAVLDLVLFAAVNAVALAGAPLGVPAALALAGYGCARFAVEFLRDQQGRTLGGHITVNHLIALALVGVGAALAGALLLGEPAAAAPISWHTSLRGAPWLSVGILPGALVVFLGFSLHRGEIGQW
jgi:phosphatidylglycerol:prolipoprotein diacylglycerol transferase